MLRPAELSVVVTSYNYGRYLPQCLEAIVSQSRPAREVIVVDDASTDDSAAQAERFARSYPSVRLIRHEVNRGFAATLKTGFENSSSEYVLFVAADDRLMPGHFAKSLELLERYPQAGFCSTMGRILGLAGEDLGMYHTPVVRSRPSYIAPADFIAAYLRRGSWFMTYATVYRRSMVEESGVFDLPAELGSQLDCYMIFYGGAKHGACFVPEPLVWWRRAEAGLGVRAMQAGARAALEQQDLLEASLRGPRCAGLFSEEFIRSWRRSALNALVYEYSRRRPEALDELLALETRLPEIKAVDRVFFGLLRRGWAGLWATKLYIFLQKPWAEKWRIVRDKFGSGRRRAHA